MFTIILQVSSNEFYFIVVIQAICNISTSVHKASHHLWGRPRPVWCLQVSGESSSYSCLTLHWWGAAEWGQCKPGLTLPTFRLTTGPEETLTYLAEIFQWFKDLFFAEWLTCVIGLLLPITYTNAVSFLVWYLAQGQCPNYKSWDFYRWSLISSWPTCKQKRYLTKHSAVMSPYYYALY